MPRHGGEGLIEEGKEALDEDMEPALLDVALIVAAQKIEHYEMSGYGSLRTLAKLIGDEQSAKLLEETLDEEKAADEKLTQIAEQIVNQRALENEEEEKRDEEESRTTASRRR